MTPLRTQSQRGIRAYCLTLGAGIVICVLGCSNASTDNPAETESKTAHQGLGAITSENETAKACSAKCPTCGEPCIRSHYLGYHRCRNDHYWGLSEELANVVFLRQPTQQRQQLTIVTNCKLSITPDTSGLKAASSDSGDCVEIMFDPTDANKDSNWAEAPVTKHVFSTPCMVRTNGAIIESNGLAGTVLEVIGIGEFNHRFPHLVSDDPELAQEAGFFNCILQKRRNGTYYCDKVNCTGSCKKKGFPILHCSCEKD